ncbi:hypothetical protein Zmor_016431 [Zophobas morio]|uniref:Uncharacterized protein n=1 Tax=Zophobas morio TaxID=2755281 RepID=A0AA38M1K0_9CUCU|nr:hypothetical protein Zmor_016431 [Zophobas morio]
MWNKTGLDLEEWWIQEITDHYQKEYDRRSDNDFWSSVIKNFQEKWDEIGEYFIKLYGEKAESNFKAYWNRVGKQFSKFWKSKGETYTSRYCHKNSTHSLHSESIYWHKVNDLYDTIWQKKGESYDKLWNRLWLPETLPHSFNIEGDFIEPVNTVSSISTKTSPHVEVHTMETVYQNVPPTAVFSMETTDQVRPSITTSSDFAEKKVEIMIKEATYPNEASTAAGNELDDDFVVTKTKTTVITIYW